LLLLLLHFIITEVEPVDARLSLQQLVTCPLLNRALACNPACFFHLGRVLYLIGQFLDGRCQAEPQLAFEEKQEDKEDNCVE
jgi:hypothetical protein